MPKLIGKIKQLEKELMNYKTRQYAQTTHKTIDVVRKPAEKWLKKGIVSLIGLVVVSLAAYAYLSSRPRGQDRIIANQHKSAVGKADKIISIANNRYRNILADYLVTKEEKEELSTLLPLNPYEGLDANKSRIENGSELRKKIQETLLAEQLFETANNLLGKGGYNEADDKINEALKILPKEKKYLTLDAKIEASIQKMANADKELRQIRINLEGKPYKKQELESILASLSDLYGGLIIDKGTEQAIESLRKQTNVALGHHSAFNKIRQDVASNKYGSDEKIREDVLSLAANLGRENLPYAKVLLSDVMGFSYIRQVKVEERIERILVKAGSPPKYEEKKANPVERILLIPFAILPGKTNIDGKEAAPGEVWKMISDGKGEVLAREGIDPVYQNVTTPAHYQKIEINPYSNTQRIVENNIPIK